jgi:hypothetical protein
VLHTLLGCATFALLFPAPPVKPSETLIRLNVSPAAAPKPALRYLLLPDLSEMEPGNPIPGYLKCFLDQDFTSTSEVLGPAALRQADRAARMDKPDWQILLKLRTDGISLLLPDVQKLRAIAQALQGRFREEIAARRFDDALVTAKTMFAIARHMNEHPTLIGSLVGVAIAQVAIGPLEELLELPGCPNLYWALTSLPNPLVAFDTGMQGERLFIQAELKDLDEVNPMTEAQIKKVVTHIDYIRQFEMDRIKDKTRVYLNKKAADPKHVDAARARLVGYGLPEARVAKFPVDQLLLLDEKYTYRVRRDDLMKYMILPTWEAELWLAKAKKPKEPALFADFLLPGVERIRRAQGRLEQRIALLRHVEAVRMYAAEHDGMLPASLADVGVPLPPDPFTGKPVRYSVEGNTAHIRGTPPKGEETSAPYNIHYEITIRK